MLFWGHTSRCFSWEDSLEIINEQQLQRWQQQQACSKRVSRALMATHLHDQKGVLDVCCSERSMSG